MKEESAESELYLDDGKSIILKNDHTKLTYQGLVETKDYLAEAAVLEDKLNIF
jgi:hypothetical protein